MQPISILWVTMTQKMMQGIYAFWRLKEKLSKMGSIEHRQVYLDETDTIRKILTFSITKLNSIVEIVKIEESNLHDNLRMVILTDYILSLMIKVLKTLKVNEENVKKNLYFTQGLNLSESVLTLLVEKGLPRQKAHELIRIAAMNAVEYQKPFKDCLLEMDDIRKLVSEEDLDHALKPENYIGTAIKQTENAISFLRRKITQWRKEILNSS